MSADASSLAANALMRAPLPQTETRTFDGTVSPRFRWTGAPVTEQINAGDPPTIVTEPPPDRCRRSSGGEFRAASVTSSRPRTSGQVCGLTAVPSRRRPRRALRRGVRPAERPAPRWARDLQGILLAAGAGTRMGCPRRSSWRGRRRLAARGVRAPAEGGCRRGDRRPRAPRPTRPRPPRGRPRRRVVAARTGPRGWAPRCAPAWRPSTPRRRGAAHPRRPART